MKSTSLIDGMDNLLINDISLKDLDDFVDRSRNLDPREREEVVITFVKRLSKLSSKGDIRLIVDDILSAMTLIRQLDPHRASIEFVPFCKYVYTHWNDVRPEEVDVVIEYCFDYMLNPITSDIGQAKRLSMVLYSAGYKPTFDRLVKFIKKDPARNIQHYKDVMVMIENQARLKAKDFGLTDEHMMSVILELVNNKNNRYERVTKAISIIEKNPRRFGKAFNMKVIIGLAKRCADDYRFHHLLTTINNFLRINSLTFKDKIGSIPTSSLDGVHLYLVLCKRFQIRPTPIDELWFKSYLFECADNIGLKELCH